MDFFKDPTFLKCPSCKEDMKEVYGGHAGNLNGRKWVEVLYECAKCGIKRKYLQTERVTE